MASRLHLRSTPRYTQTNMSPHMFDHFCTRYEALYVPQRFINALYSQMNSDIFGRIGSGRPCLRETPTFKHVHPSAYAPASLNVQLSL